MKKRLMILGALATAGIVATTSLTSCSDDKNTTSPVDNSSQIPTPTPVLSDNISSTVADPVISSIVVSGQTTVFGIGDEISKGNAKVTAYYSDNTNQDVTANASFDFSKVNNKEAGTYEVSVSAAGKTTKYNVEVKEYTLESIEVEASDNDKIFNLYSSIDFSNIVVKGVYKHPTNNTTNKKTVNNSDVTFVVKDSDGNVVENQFTKYGKYTVEVSYAQKKTSFEVECKISLINSLEDAVSSAVKAESTINGGSINYEFKDTGYDSSDSSDTDFSNSYSSSYKYGTNFVIVDKNGVKTYFSAIDDNTAFAVTEDGNDIYLGSNSEFEATVDDSKLVGINFFDKGVNSHGIASIISELYDIYSNSTSVGEKKDSKGICEHLENKEGFKFSFTYLTEEFGSYVFNRYNVEFIINDSGAIEKAYVFVESFQSVENPNYGPSSEQVPSDLPVEIVSEEKDGITSNYFKVKDGAKTSGETTWSFTQTSGSKEVDNPYDPSKLSISSFILKSQIDENIDDRKDGPVKDNFKETQLDETIELDLDNGNSQKDNSGHRFVIEYEISDIVSPSSFNLDEIVMSVSGISKDGHIITPDDFSYIYASSYDGYKVYINKPGTYQVTFKSRLVTKVINYNVEYEAPYEISASIHNGEKDSSFVSENSFDMYVSNTIYIGADILEGFDPNFTLECSSDKITLEAVKYNGVDCYKVNAKEAGEYTLIIKGAKSKKEGHQQATSTIKLNVSEEPQINDIIGQNNGLFEAVVSSELSYVVLFDTTNSTVKIYNKLDNTKFNLYNYSYENKVIDLGFPTQNDLDIDFTIEISSFYDIYLNDGTKSYKIAIPEENIPEKDIDAASILNGKYTVTTEMFGTTQEISFEFIPTSLGATSGTVTVITDGNASKAGYYNYSYDSTNKSVSFVLASGKNKYIDDKIEITSEGLIYHFNEDSTYPFVRYEEKEDIDITDYLGSWVSSDGLTIILYADSVRDADGEYNISSISYNANNEIEINVNDGFLILTIKSQTEMVDNWDCSYTKQTNSLEMDSNMIGIWFDQYDTRFEITSSGLTMTSYGDSYSYVLESIDNGIYKVVDVTDSSYYYELYFNDGILYVNDGYNESQLTNSSQSNLEIHEDFIGKWIDNENNIMIISKDSILWNNESASNIQCELVEDVYYLSFEVNGTTFEGGSISDGKLSIRIGINQWYEFEKSEIDEVVDISQYLGKWVAEDTGFYIELSDTSFTNGEDTFTIISITKDNDKIIIVGEFKNIQDTLTIDGDVMVEDHPTFGQSTYQKQSSDSSSNEFANELIGMWMSDGLDTIEITKDTFTSYGYVYTLVSIEGNVYNIIDDTGYEDSFIFDGTSIDYCGVIYTKYSNNDLEIPESFRGQWEDEANSIQLTISTDSIIWNNVEATGIAYEEGYLSFNVPGYDELFTGSFEGDNLIVSYNYYAVTYSFSPSSSNDNGSDSMTKFLGGWTDGIVEVYIGSTSIDFNGIEPSFTLENDSIEFTNDGKNYVLSILDDKLIVTIDGEVTYTLNKME